MSVVHHDPDYYPWQPNQIEKLLRLLPSDPTTFHILFKTNPTFKDVIADIKEYFPSSNTSSSSNGISVLTKPLNHHTITSIASLFQENKEYVITSLRIINTLTGTIELDVDHKKIKFYNKVFTPTIQELYDIFPDIVNFTHYFDSKNC
jgi:hypothetical protein